MKTIDIHIEYLGKGSLLGALTRKINELAGLSPFSPLTLAQRYQKVFRLNPEVHFWVWAIGNDSYANPLDMVGEIDKVREHFVNVKFKVFCQKKP